MAVEKIPGGLVHEVPKDLETTISSSPEALKTWHAISAIARNEWICWAISVKQEKTRNIHVERAGVELSEGKKRPCCWMGCIHRTDKPISPSVKSILRNQKRTTPSM